MKTHRIEQPLPGAQPAYLANGLIGLRVPQLPLPQGTALVNGFVGLSPEVGTEQYAPAPYPVGADLGLDGLMLSDHPHRAAFVSQEVDFACGELRSVFTYAGANATATVEVLTFCSRTQPALVLQEMAVTVDKPCKLTLQAHIDPRGLPGALGERVMPGKYADGILRWESRGGLASVGAAYASDFVGEDLESRRRNDFGHERDMELTQYHVAAKPGRRYTMRQFGSLVPSLMHGEPHWQASRHVGMGRWHGFDKLRADNRAAWAELWKSSPRLVGRDVERWQQIADACYFYLHSSVSPSTPCGVAPFGLGRHKEYGGHVFWDYETFMYPAVLLSAPETARATMEYRSGQLPLARYNAQLNGYRGIQYPWQAGNVGFEVSPFYSGAAGGATEQHINLDVAFAMIQYVYASGDELFFRQHAWPVIQGVAEWIVSRVTKTARGYEILHVTGIDETRDNVDNDAETNGLSAIILWEAAALAGRLGAPAPAAWTAIADGLFIPIDPQTKIIRKNDSYEPANHACTDTMMLTFPFGYPLDPAVHAATVRFNLEHAHTYLGAPMNSADFAVWAARAGERALALEFLERGTADRLVEPFLQMLEYTPARGNLSGHTCFITACGALHTALLQGLTGLHLDAGAPAGWAKHPVILPEGWDAIEVERFWARGEAWHLTARQGAERAALEVVE